ncbi:cytochrome P450 [Suillus clintonianus]|uniref:cytochrome P450 n=1 Tax=Suillus clintonianus TaxID=1904413 RepID=UPI001B883273|nr:cytochrome P450 [Suillus clintonianus]KAG2147652.1 cytochrome P450 [Suillus clintonianus]
MISGAALCLVAFLAYIAWRNSRRYTLKDIRGPPSHSFWLGSEKVHRNTLQVGDLEFQWAREYGPTWMTKGCLGEEVLWTADPRALQYVFHTSGYRYPKRTISNEITRLFTGKSILTTDAIDHQRHRKIMNPAFGASQLRTFLPVFRRSAARLSQKWKDIIQLREKSDGCTLNINETLSRMTLDVIGEVAFDHRFGVLNDNGSDNELVQAFNNLFLDTLLNPSSWDIIFKSTWRFLPQPILNCLKYLPSKENRRFATFLQTAIQTGKAIVNEQAAGTEKGSKDIISILVQSNRMEDARSQLSETEILSQIATLLVAGHDTTASTLTWLLYELSKHPEDQQRIRDEIKVARANVEARGDDDLLPGDFNNMAFTNAIIKEGLRLHPIVPTLVREADSDDVIPLAQPIETKSGKIINEIPISKGQGITASICTYNRLKSVWGEDADEWNPNRFLDDARERSSLGVFANLCVFNTAGLRACIGLLEMQAVLVELVENFEYQFPEGVEVIRLNAGLMAPMIEGKMHEGIQMPLEVTLIS